MKKTIFFICGVSAVIVLAMHSVVLAQSPNTFTKQGSGPPPAGPGQCSAIQWYNDIVNGKTYYCALPSGTWTLGTGTPGATGGTGATGATGTVSAVLGTALQVTVTGATGPTATVSLPSIIAIPGPTGAVYPASAGGATDLGTGVVENASTVQNDLSWGKIQFDANLIVNPIVSPPIGSAGDGYTVALIAATGNLSGSYSYTQTYTAAGRTVIPQVGSANQAAFVPQTESSSLGQSAILTTDGAHQQISFTGTCSPNARVTGETIYRTSGATPNIWKLIPAGEGTASVSGTAVTASTGTFSSAWVGRMFEITNPSVIYPEALYGGIITAYIDSTHVTLLNALGNGSITGTWVVTPTLDTTVCAGGNFTYTDNNADSFLQRPLPLYNSTGGSWFMYGVPFLVSGYSGLGGGSYSGQNVHLGLDAGNQRNPGSGNVGIGGNTLAACTFCVNDVAIGGGQDNSPGSSLTTGSSNVLIGSDTAFNATTGISNTVVGGTAGNTIVTASTNDLFGYQSNISSDAITNASCWGSGCVAFKSHTQFFSAGVQGPKGFLFGLYNLGYVPPDYSFLTHGNAAWTWGAAPITSGDATNFFLTFKAPDAGSGATNANGGDLYLRGGLSTGTGHSSNHFQFCLAGTTGTSYNTCVDAITANPVVNSPIAFGYNTSLALKSQNNHQHTAGGAVAVNTLVKLSGGTRVTQTATTDTGTPLFGIAETAAGGFGATIDVTVSGIGTLTFDGSLTDGDIVVASTTTAGWGHDSGVSNPQLLPAATSYIGYISYVSGTCPNTSGSTCLVQVAPGFGGLGTILTGTTGSIGGSLLTIGTCSSGTATVTGATTSMVATASPVTYPGDGNYWLAYVSASNTVTVKLCAVATLTPTASVYNVRVIE